MKKSMKTLALLLAVVLLLCSCDSNTQSTQPTQPTQPTESEPVAITTEELLVAALETKGRVIIASDMALTKGVAVKDNLLDGGGCTLTAPAYNKDDPNTSAGLFITKGTIENVTIKGGYRGISTTSEYRVSGDIRVKNATLDGENCGLIIGHGGGQGVLYVDHCDLGSQTVFTRIAEAQFTNCTFRWNEIGTKGNLTAYSNVTIIGCRFENLQLEDGTVKLYTIAFGKDVAGLTMTLENCYVGDTLITPENINSLLKVQPRKNTIQVHNTER